MGNAEYMGKPSGPSRKTQSPEEIRHRHGATKLQKSSHSEERCLLFVPLCVIIYDCGGSFSNFSVSSCFCVWSVCNFSRSGHVWHPSHADRAEIRSSAVPVHACSSVLSGFRFLNFCAFTASPSRHFSQARPLGF